MEYGQLGPSFGKFASIQVVTKGLRVDIGIEDELDFEILEKALEKVRRNMKNPPPDLDDKSTGMASN